MWLCDDVFNGHILKAVSTQRKFHTRIILRMFIYGRIGALLWWCVVRLVLTLFTRSDAAVFGIVHQNVFPCWLRLPFGVGASGTSCWGASRAPSAGGAGRTVISLRVAFVACGVADCLSRRVRAFHVCIYSLENPCIHLTRFLIYIALEKWIVQYWYLKVQPQHWHVQSQHWIVQCALRKEE